MIDPHKICACVTTYDRPRSLLALVESIRRFYPELPIRVADNGTSPADGPDLRRAGGADFRVDRLPADCGLSASRNWLIDHCPSRYMLLLEDDFRFTDDTRIETLVHVLDIDPEVGVVGGALLCDDGVVDPFNKQFVRSGSTLSLMDGDHWIPCDMVSPFALFRHEMLDQYRWDERIKIGGENLDFYLAVQRGRRWLIISSPDVVCEHVGDVGDTDDYRVARARAELLYEPVALRKWGLRQVVGSREIPVDSSDCQCNGAGGIGDCPIFPHQAMVGRLHQICCGFDISPELRQKYIDKWLREAAGEVVGEPAPTVNEDPHLCLHNIGFSRWAQPDPGG